MFNRHKRKTIVEWYNCLCSTEPIESFAQLKDGIRLFKVVKQINSIENDVETIDARYANVESCINSFYSTESHVLVDFNACRTGNTFELAKVTILLMSALVNTMLMNGDETVSSLTMLDQEVQEDIKEIMTAVLMKSDSYKIELSSNFAHVLSTHHSVSPVSVSPSSSYHTPQRGQRKRSRSSSILPEVVVDSPLKLFMDSPQMVGQIALKRKEREIENLKKHVKDLSSQCTESDNKMDQLEADNISKGAKLKELQNLVDQLRKCQEQPNQRILRGKTRWSGGTPCRNCALHKKDIEQKEADYNELKEELDNKTSKMDVMQSDKMEILEEAGVLQFNVLTAEETMRQLQLENKQLKESLTSSQETSRSYSEMYNEVKQKLKDGENVTCSFCTKLVTPDCESMEVVPEKRIEELKAEIEAKNQELVSLRRKLMGAETTLKKLREARVVAAGSASQLKAKVKDLTNKLERVTEQLQSTEDQSGAMEFQLNSASDKLRDEIAKSTALGKEIKVLQQQIQQIVNGKHAIERELSLSVKKNGDLSNEIATMKLEIARFDEERMGMRDKLMEMAEQLKASAEERASLEGNVNFLQERNTKLQEEVSNMTSELRNKDEYISRSNLEAVERNELSETVQSQLKEQLVAKEKEFSDLKIVKDSEILCLNQKLAKLSADLEGETIGLEEFRSRNSVHVRKINELEQRLISTEAELESVKKFAGEEQTKLKTQLEVQRKDKDNALYQNSNLMSELEKLLCKNEEYKTKIQSLESLKEQLIQSNNDLREENSSYVIEANKNQTIVKKLKEDNESLRQGNPPCPDSQNYLVEKSALESKIQMLENNEKIKNEHLKDVKTFYDKRITDLENSLKEADKIKSTLEQSERDELARLKAEQDGLLKRVDDFKSEKEALCEIKEKNIVEMQSLKALISSLQTEKDSITQQFEKMRDQPGNENVPMLVHENNDLKSKLAELEVNCQKFQSMLLEKDSFVSRTQGELHQQTLLFTQSTLRNEELLRSSTAVEAECKNLKLQIEQLTTSSQLQKQEMEQLSASLINEKKRCQDLILEKARLEETGSTSRGSNIEYETLLEKIDDLERNMRVVMDSKELAEKEYYMCIEEKENIIEKLRNELQEAKNLKFKNGDKDNDHEHDNDIVENQKVINGELKEKLLTLQKSNNTLVLENKKFKETEKWIKDEKDKIRQEMKSFSDNILSKNAKRDQILKECQQQFEKLTSKHEKAKNVIQDLEAKIKERDQLLKSYSDKLGALRNRAQTKKAEEKEIQEELLSLKRLYQDSKQDLERTQRSFSQSKERIHELSASIKKFQHENVSLKAQIKMADTKLRELRKPQPVNNGGHHTPLTRRQTVSAFHQDPVRMGPLTKVKKESKEKYPLVIQKITKEMMETRVIPDHNTSNVSAISEGLNNRSALGGHFHIDEEEAFFDASSVLSLHNMPPLPSPSVRVNELLRRNTMCPPHMRSVYPAEDLPSKSYYQDKPKADSKDVLSESYLRKRRTLAGSVTNGFKKMMKIDTPKFQKSANNPFHSPSIAFDSNMFTVKTPTSARKLLMRKRYLESPNPKKAFKGLFNL